MIVNCSFPIDENLASALKFLGIQTIGIELPRSQLTSIDLEFDVISRLILIEPQLSAGDIKQKIQTERFNYDIIIVEAVSASLASYVAHNSRIDAIRLGSSSKLSVFNTRYARRLGETQTLVEVDLSPFFRRNLAKNLRPLLRILNSFQKCNLNYSLVNTIKGTSRIRSYRGLQALAGLLGLNRKQTSPQHLARRVLRNRRKIKGKSPYNGVVHNGS